MKIILTDSLSKIVNEFLPEPITDEELKAVVDMLDKAAIKSAKKTSVINSQSVNNQYAIKINKISKSLKLQMGDFPDDIAGLMLIRGDLTAEKFTEMIESITIVSPRETIRRMFIKTLMSAHESFKTDRELTLKTATAIEISCYNGVVRTCKSSEDPPRRDWNEPIFVNMYGSRCGAINGLLDPNSSSCLAYGPNLITQLVNKEILPNEIGSKSIDKLCPQATAVERTIIANRSTQKVQTNASNLFRCPHCGERNCSYQEVQRRALDEAPDYFCFCLSCNRPFKGHS